MKMMRINRTGNVVLVFYIEIMDHIFLFYLSSCNFQLCIDPTDQYPGSSNLVSVFYM